MDECEAILLELGVKLCRYEQDKREVGGRQRITLLIHVTNRPGVIKTIEAVLPYLIGKAEQAKTLLNACIDWESLPIECKMETVASIKEMNRRVPRLDGVDSSEAKSIAPNVVG